MARRLWSSADDLGTHVQAFRQEQEEQAAASKGRKATSAADAREVARVRASRTDYECLRVRCSAYCRLLRIDCGPIVRDIKAFVQWRTSMAD